MLFNSFEFLVFLPVVFLLYWFVLNRNLKLQNLFVLLTSYVFYGWWDWRFLTLIFFSSLTDYLTGLGLGKAEKKGTRVLLLVVSLTVNLGLLGFFKYFDFFVDSFIALMASFGLEAHRSSLQIILPVGISFYTFQTLSYSIDIFRRKLEPTKDIIAFFAFVSFFPQLVAGPIERAKNLLPQFFQARSFSYPGAVDGARQILWGFFKKIAIADTAAAAVNRVFSRAPFTDVPGVSLFFGVLMFAFQIYGDFSGYSDIAIGTSRLLGFRLMRNFACPYFSRDIAEFWRRWHISLSSWFRDYVYIPLGGSRSGRGSRIRNILITFTLSGLWHGADFKFIAWGFLNGCYYIPLMLLGRERKHKDIAGAERLFPSWKEVLQIAGTFFLTLIAWVFFRASSLRTAFDYLYRMFANLALRPEVIGNWLGDRSVHLIVLMLVLEWVQRRRQHGLDVSGCPAWVRWGLYLAVGLLIMTHADLSLPQEFIYFQF